MNTKTVPALLALIGLVDAQQPEPEWELPFENPPPNDFDWEKEWANTGTADPPHGQTIILGCVENCGRAEGFMCQTHHENAGCAEGLRCGKP